MFISTINIDKSKRLWIVILLALAVAASLIITSFISVYLKKDENIDENVLFNLNSYHAEYELVVFSNKNQNSYFIKEWYLNDNGNESFKIEFENALKDKFSYVLTKNNLNINSDKQLSDFHLDGYNINKKNLISISTFLELYSKVLSANQEKIMKIENKNIDNTKHYIIHIDNADNKNPSEIVEEYDDILSEGLNISKIELVVNDKNIPIEYYVFNDKQNVIIGIKYTKFDIIDKFDENIFANLNK